MLQQHNKIARADALVSGRDGILLKGTDQEDEWLHWTMMNLKEMTMLRHHWLG